MLLPSHSKSFTLLELLIVIGIIAVLATVLIAVLNPADYRRRSNDSRRLTDLRSLNDMIALYDINTLGALVLGSPNTVYISLPSDNENCSDLDLPDLPPSWSYHCANAQNFRKTDSTGWLPIDFTQDETINLPALPIDPVNTVQGGYYYTYAVGGSWELTAQLESQRHTINQATDGGLNPARYELGTDTKLTPFINGLVGSWSFNETSGNTAYDSSGFGNHGTMYSSTTPSYLISNQTLDLDGIDDYVDCGNDESLNITEAVTIEAWVNFTSKTGYAGLVSKGDHYRYLLYQYGGGDALGLYIVTASGTKATGPVYGCGNGLWHHVVGTFDKSLPNKRLKFYKDGVEVETAGGYNEDILTNAEPFFIGKYSYSHFKGLIDEVRIYNRAFSATEIQAIYEASKLNYQ